MPEARHASPGTWCAVLLVIEAVGRTGVLNLSSTSMTGPSGDGAGSFSRTERQPAPGSSGLSSRPTARAVLMPPTRKHANISRPRSRSASDHRRIASGSAPAGTPARRTSRSSSPGRTRLVLGRSHLRLPATGRRRRPARLPSSHRRVHAITAAASSPATGWKTRRAGCPQRLRSAAWPTGSGIPDTGRSDISPPATRGH